MEDLRLVENHLKISARYMPRFNELLKKAEKEAQQLRDTLAELSRFEFDIEVTAESGQRGDIEAASSAISIIPTK